MEEQELLTYISKYKFPKQKNIAFDLPFQQIVLRILFKRLQDATESFLLLIKNCKTEDALIIAGHILETSALIYYLTHSKKSESRANKYMMKCIIQGTISILSINNNFSEDTELNTLYQKYIQYIEEYGKIVLKKTKNTRLILDNKLFVEKLKDKTVSRAEKIDTLKNYDKPNVMDYIKHFLNGMESTITINQIDIMKTPRTTMLMFYELYCRYKHASIFMYNPKETQQYLELEHVSKYLSIPAVAFCLSMIENKVSLIT